MKHADNRDPLFVESSVDDQVASLVKTPKPRRQIIPLLSEARFLRESLEASSKLAQIPAGLTLAEVLVGVAPDLVQVVVGKPGELEARSGHTSAHRRLIVGDDVLDRARRELASLDLPQA